MKIKSLILAVLLVASAACNFVSCTQPAPTPITQAAHTLNVVPGHVFTVSSATNLAEVLKRPDAPLVLEADGRVKKTGPHIHPHPVYFIKGDPNPHVDPM